MIKQLSTAAITVILALALTAATVGGASMAEPKKPRHPALVQPLPDTPGARAKLLDDLYALLATAEDDEAATEISRGIERLWLGASGSDTIAVLMERAVKAANDKNTDLALQLLDAIVDLAPDYAEGWNRRASVFYLANNVNRALGDLRRVLALDPNHFKALEGLGQVLREMGEKKAALAAFKKLLDVHPNSDGAKKAVDDLEREVGGQGI